MPSLIEILLTATDQTGPGFASAQNNLRVFTAALGQQSATYTATGNAAAASGQRVASGSQKAAAAQTQEADSARTLEQLEGRLAATQLRLALASTDSRGKIALLRQEHQRLEAATRPLVLSTQEYTRRMNAAAEAALRLRQAENARERGLGPTLPRSLEQFGTGALAQAGIGLGIAALGQQIVQLGSQSIDLAVKAETIGTAYEAATRRAGVGADDLLEKLRQASRGTIAETDLQLRANQALALGVGKNANEIAALLAIARQRGKDFGITTNEAFESMVIGIGRGSTEWLDNIGIVLDSQKIYKDQAEQLDITVDQLTKQQKITAVLNEVLRTNSDLVRKNAVAQIDAADQIAQANVRRENAQTRIGPAITPLQVGFLDAVAGTLEGLFRTTRGQAEDLNQTLLTASTSYADYTDRIQAKRQELLKGGGAGKSEQEELFLAMVTQQEYNLARALAVQTDRHERNAAAATRNADALKNLATVTAPAATPQHTRYTPYANLTVSPAQTAAMQGSGGVTNVYHIPVTVQGSMVHTGDVVDGIVAGVAAQERRGGVTGWGGRGGFNETRGRR